MTAIHPRSEWGAAPSKGAYSNWSVSPRDLVVHYVGGSGDIGIHSHADCPAHIRSVQAYEQGHGYIDIAYNLVLCPHGVVYEARGLGHAGAANGPRTNGSKPSVLYLSNNTALTPEALGALHTLWAEHGPALYGHREVNSTSCPGDPIFGQVVAMRSGAIQPPAPPTPPNAPAPGLYALAQAIHALDEKIKAAPTLRKGDRGAHVSDLQFALSLLGQTVAIDGSFGPQTDTAVRNVQRFWKLGVDGIVGPQTKNTIAWLLTLKFP